MGDVVKELREEVGPWQRRRLFSFVRIHSFIYSSTHSTTMLKASFRRLVLEGPGDP